jgi:acylphosphatase
VNAQRIVISGRVQGVWYRAWTMSEANKRSLKGWVRNLSTGQVEALFAGPVTLIEEMVDACRQGPPLAKVTRIESFEAEEPDENGFHQRPDA